MRGENRSSGSLFSYVDLEARVPARHPLRVIRSTVNDVLVSLSSEFEALYSHTGRPSIPPEQLLRALLLQASYSVRSERQLMEPLDFNMLYRCFVGLGMDDPVWDASTFRHNRDRLLEADSGDDDGGPGPQRLGGLQPDPIATAADGGGTMKRWWSPSNGDPNHLKSPAKHSKGNNRRQIPCSRNQNPFAVAVLMPFSAAC